MKLLANIAYHHNPERLPNLIRVIEAIKSYPVQADIFVDTNDPEVVGLLADQPVTVHAHTQLSHPWMLTAVHRTRIKETYKYFDWVAYFEDDMMLPKEGFVNFTERFDSMFADGLYPSFTRIETYDDKEGECTPDVNEVLPSSVWCQYAGKDYVSLPFFINYHAFWMFSTKRLKEVLTRNPGELDHIPNNGLFRESLASFPIWSLNLKPMLEFTEQGELADHCKVFHLTNNYKHGSTNIKTLFKR